jgi:hypothetical protein
MSLHDFPPISARRDQLIPMSAGAASKAAARQSKSTDTQNTIEATMQAARQLFEA